MTVEVAPEMGGFFKQPSEQFKIYGDFSTVLATDEVLDINECSVVAEDNGGDADITVLDQSYISVIDDQYLRIGVQAGVEAKSPYKITFYGGATGGYPTYEIDVVMKIKDL